jgi:hypothetical protein
VSGRVKAPRAATYEEGPWGLSWVIDEPLTRTSHALADGGRVWLVDPVDEPEALERALALGTPAAVLQLLDRHGRDCAALAARLGVPHLKVPRAVPDSPFDAVQVLHVRGWHEAALWWPERRVLVVAETLGTNGLYRMGPGAVGVHLLLRAKPPGALRAFTPDHLLVGHGAGVHDGDAGRGVAAAYDRARRDLPAALLKAPLQLWRAR